MDTNLGLWEIGREMEEVPPSLGHVVGVSEGDLFLRRKTPFLTAFLVFCACSCVLRIYRVFAKKEE